MDETRTLSVLAASRGTINCGGCGAVLSGPDGRLMVTGHACAVEARIEERITAAIEAEREAIAGQCENIVNLWRSWRAGTAPAAREKALVAAFGDLAIDIRARGKVTT